MNYVNNEKFGHSQHGAYLFHLDFSKGTLTKHLYLYLPCLGNN